MNELDCTAARAALLEADLAELRAEGESALARHVAQCPACAAVAARLQYGHAELDSGLARLRPRSRARKPALLWTTVPLAAAAVLALLLLPHPRPAAAPTPTLLALLFPEPPVVTPRPGQQAVVIEKNDLTVVWLYNDDGGTK